MSFNKWQGPGYTRQQQVVIKSHKAHMVGDLLLAWHDHYGLCTFSVQGFYLRNDNLESIAIPAVYNMLELKELINE